MESLKYSMIDFLKTNRLAKPIYRSLKKRINSSGVKMEELKAIVPIAESEKGLRFNLVLPTLRKTKVFGGILTTIKILNKLIAKFDVNARVIVVLNERYNKKWTYKVEGYGYNNEAENQLVFLDNTDKLSVRKNDIFIFTSWRTAYLMMPVLNWQIRNYKLIDRKAIYLIQDYEPGFFPWSTDYLLAESTYKTNPENIIALYNSKELFDYFKRKGYGFAVERYFSPSLNEELKKKLLNSERRKKNKQIMIYGRPSEHRNAFEIIKGALIIWSEQYPKAKEWTIISLGEDYEDVLLKNNRIKVLGKVSLDEYAEILLSSYAGISLMVSPHPSYPPLEMSTFGVQTITNSFKNKNLSYFNPNMISLSNCTPKAIADKLMEICETYNNNEAIYYIDNDYVIGGHFDTVIDEIGKIVDGMVNKN